MKLSDFKPLIILGAVVGVLLVALLIITAVNNSSSSNTSNSNSENKSKNITYPEVTDNEEEILSKIYNPDYDYYTGFINASTEKEGIFGNEKEVVAKAFDQKTRMTLALYSFKLSDMEKVSCSTISWNNSWDSSCGMNGSNMAYILPVGELNNRVEEMFNVRPDYSLLNIDDLTIGTCTGDNKSAYVFRYIKDRSIYVSTKRTNKCVNNGKIEVTDIEKTQANDLLTLIVNYKKKDIISLGNKLYYGNIKEYQDKFFFKVKKDGSYYFNSSTLIKEIN